MISKAKPCADQSLFSFVANTQRLTIRTNTHPCVSLIAPIIGNDFVAGIDELSGRWLCISQQHIESLVANTQQGSDLPNCRVHPGGIVDFLASIPTPTRVLVGEQLLSVRAFAHGWAILANPTGITAVPLASQPQFALFEAPDREALEVAA